MKITSPTAQLVLDFEPGLVERFRSLRECVASGVYQRGLKRVAADMDQAPGNLSVQLADDSQRHFSVDSLERYVQVTGDLTPIYYLAERYLADRNAAREAAHAEVLMELQKLQRVMKKAGLA
jgi:hypothetical protein